MTQAEPKIRPQLHAGKKVLVVGLKRTGLACLEFLRAEGARVVGNDSKSEAELGPDAARARATGATLQLGGHPSSVFLAQDLIVVSPGVPLDLEPLRAAQEQGIPVISEIELAWPYLNAPVAGITGTNGKSTTTELIGEICRQAGRRVFVGGNLGTPLIEAVMAGAAYDALIVELSSFQLEGIREFRPEVAVLLNITPDHLNRYPDFAAYEEAKMRIFMNQGLREVAVLNADDPRIVARSKAVKAEKLFFGGHPSPEGGAWLEGGLIRVEVPGRASFDLDPATARLKGRHHLENMMASALTAASLGIGALPIQQALASFKGLPHRMEWVRTLRGVDFYDDSKATNVGATEKSLLSFDRPVVLIAGGEDKGGSYAPLEAEVRRHVRALVLIGEAAPLIARAFAGMTHIENAADLPAAVAQAYALAQAGDVVLLAPACASFDMFSNYQHRGRVFGEAVQALK